MSRYRYAWVAVAFVLGTSLRADEPPAKTPNSPPPVELLPDFLLPPIPPEPPPVTEEIIFPRTTRPAPQPNCPPGTVPSRPFDPSRPTDPSRPPTDPSMPPPPDQPMADPLARAPEAGAQPSATLNPNLFGDQFSGTNSSRLARRVTLTVLQAGTPDAARFLGVVNGRTYTPHPQFAADFPARVILEGREIRLGNPNFTSVATVLPVQGQRPVNGLLESAGVTAALGGAFNKSVARFVSGTATEAPDANALFTPHQVNLVYDIDQRGIALGLPPDGGVVGRSKLSDDNSPMPRDRVIFGFDYYANPLLAAGLDVYRFSPGFETTFFDRMASIEFRMPFASTLDNITGPGGVATRDIELGNAFAALKYLFLSGQELNASVGVSMAFPTAADAKLESFFGGDLVKVKNRSILVSPYVAALYTPGDRFFAQGWIQGSFDLTGNPVSTNFDGRGLVETGKLRDQARMSFDAQIGYWIMRETRGDGLRGLAPFFELHWNTTLTDADQVASQPGTIIGISNARFDDVNATVGVTALIGTNTLVQAGLVVPLREGEDRFFDYQFGIRANWFFGPTARARELADATGGRPEALPGMTGSAGGAPLPGGITSAPATDSGAGPSPMSDVLARAPETGAQPSATLNPGFFGDLIGVNGQTVPGTSRFNQLPVLPRYAGLKVTDHDGPRLADRFFFSFNQYTDVNGSVNPPNTPSLRLNRQLVGFETSFDDRYGVGIRVPFLQLSGAREIDAREIGDVTLIGKYAIVNDPGSGNIFTIGANLTLPTGGRGDGLGRLADGSPLPRAVFLQPWVGAVWNWDDFFFQGTSALLMPTSPVYPATAFNSVGMGYWAYRDSADAFVRGIAPVIELHVNTPINNRGSDNLIIFRDQANLTTGLFMQFTRLTLGGAVCVPLVGPKPYDLEAMITASYQF